MLLLSCSLGRPPLVFLPALEQLPRGGKGRRIRIGTVTHGVPSRANSPNMSKTYCKNTNRSRAPALRWKFSNNVTENLCSFLHNTASDISFAIKGQAWALWPETFGCVTATQPGCRRFSFCLLPPAQVFRCKSCFAATPRTPVSAVLTYLQMAVLVWTRESGAHTSTCPHRRVECRFFFFFFLWHKFPAACCFKHRAFNPAVM